MRGRPRTPENPFQSDGSSPGHAGRVRDKDAGSADSSAIGATEDAVSRRPARPGDTALRSETGSITPEEIRGSTTIVELLRLFPEGAAAQLMTRLAWPCAHCGGAFHEPLTMAAKRHARDPRAVLTAFRALASGELTEEQVAAAAKKVA
jgi:hypothetical protein